MITILPAFAACAYIPQLVRHALLLLVKCMPPLYEAGALQQSLGGCTPGRILVPSLNILHGIAHYINEAKGPELQVLYRCWRGQYTIGKLRPLPICPLVDDIWPATRYSPQGTVGCQASELGLQDAQ